VSDFDAVDIPDPAGDGTTNTGKFEPGSVKINSANIVAESGRIDITNLIVNLTIYESIMCPFITGSVSLYDTNALGDLFPLIGEELFLLDIETPMGGGSDDELVRRKYVFHLYKMEGRENAAVKNVMYTLHFMSTEAVVDMNTRISQTFRGKISDTVRRLLTTSPGLRSAKTLLIEETANADVYTSNFWTPVENIMYCAKRAVNQVNNPNYVFFEAGDALVFSSLDKLYSLPPVQFFKKDQASRQGKSIENVDIEYQKVLDMSTPILYDYIERLHHGMYGGSIYHFDIETKRLNFAARVGKDDYKKVNLNTIETFGEGLQFHPYGQLRTQVIHKDLYTNTPVLPIDHGIRRLSLLKRSESLKTTIQVFGRFDYTVGRTVDLLVYKDTNISSGETDVIDKLMSGRYLITALTHSISGLSHMVYMELSKDSLVSEN